jgi:hypothetical protein
VEEIANYTGIRGRNPNIVPVFPDLSKQYGENAKRMGTFSDLQPGVDVVY